MKRKREVLWGLLFILGAIFVVVSQLGYFQDVSVFTIVFAIVLIGILIDNIVHKSFGGILFPIAFLGILFDRQLGIEAITPWPILFTAVLGTIGLNMIFRKKSGWWDKCESKWYYNKDSFKEIIDQEDDEQVKCEASFSSATKYINSTHFRKANLETSFGKLTVYFDNAAIADGKAVAKVETSFGEMELYIPKEWKVILDVDTSFGGIREHGKYSGTSEENTLLIVGEVSFGSMEIYYI